MMLQTLRARKTLRNTAVVVIACAVLAVSQATNVYFFFGGRRTWIFSLATTLPPWLIMAGTAPILTWLARSFSVTPRHAARSAIRHVVAGSIFALSHVALVGFTYAVMVHDPTWNKFIRSFKVAFNYLFYQDVLAYGAVIGVSLALHYSDLRTRLAEARLTALRAQLNPHFLFNTLNAVSTLSLRGRHEEVAEMIGRLGGLLRATLDRPVQEVPLAMEMTLVDDYLAIQRVRFADRLHLQKAIEPDTLDALMPSLLLQPILENAVEHGIGQLADPNVTISIRARRQADTLVIEVDDGGQGFPDSDRVERIGLGNTRERLQELYGSEHRFEYGNRSTGGARVRIVIPFRTNAGAAVVTHPVSFPVSVSPQRASG